MEMGIDLVRSASYLPISDSGTPADLSRGEGKKPRAFSSDRSTRWSLEADEKLLELRKAGLNWAEIGKAMGVSKRSAEGRFRWINITPERRERRIENERVRRAKNRAPTIRSSRPPSQVHTVQRPPDDIMADRDRRHAAPKTLTAWLCGDPPPGWSALDRRQS